MRIALDRSEIPEHLRQYFRPVGRCGVCFVCHLVEVFREVRRVLRDDGTLWLNLGDSYAGSGKGPSNSVQSEASQIGPSAIKKRNPAQFANGQAPTSWIPVGAGYKPKDLMLMPARVALALQADGWYLRSQIPWLKRNSMPESVQGSHWSRHQVEEEQSADDAPVDCPGCDQCRTHDGYIFHLSAGRPSTAVEYVFLLSKSSRYFWDADAVRESSATSSQERAYLGKRPVSDRHIAMQDAGMHGKSDTLRVYDRNGRNRRNSDWFFESWQGLLLDEQDEPLALIVNPAPFKESHFATFPPKLVEPMVKASTSEKGQCPECGAAWVRVMETSGGSGKSWHDHLDDQIVGQRDQDREAELAWRNGTYRRKAAGWRSSCAHTDLVPIPQTILDPFAGSGTVGLVADRLGRNAILCELSDKYGEMGRDRVVGDAPMFVEFEDA
jgi:hypothetical protein